MMQKKFNIIDGTESISPATFEVELVLEHTFLSQVEQAIPSLLYTWFAFSVSKACGCEYNTWKHAISFQTMYGCRQMSYADSLVMLLIVSRECDIKGLQLESWETPPPVISSGRAMSDEAG
jgi:hypothetical protein